jgi:hypothetical protein
MFRFLIFIWSVFSLDKVQAVSAEPAMGEVLKIARAISVVQPYLENSKYIEYALGIRRAAQKYGVEPSVLIAITQQESGFRENLREGRAGEIGICQIIKSWLLNPRFIREFGNVSKWDLRRPAKSFLYAAWILRNLKAEAISRTLPYWSYYNSKHFEARLKYFLRVNRNIAMLRKAFPVFAAQPRPQVPALSQSGRAARTTASARPILSSSLAEAD